MSASSLRYSTLRGRRTVLRQSEGCQANRANVCIFSLSTSIRANRPNSRIVGLRIKSRDHKAELISPSPHHDAVVHPKEHAAAILAQVDREMARIKERDHHWEDGIEVHLLLAQVSIPADVFRRMPISPSRSPRLNGTSNGSPPLNRI